jgi:hypothetical protein
MCIKLVYFDADRRPVIEVFDDPAIFEEGVRLNKIVRNEEVRTLPPWLKSFENVDLDESARMHICQGRQRMTLSQCADARFEKIRTAVEDKSLIGDPELERRLNALARSQRPVQNEVRFRRWYFLYEIYGTKWAILPSFFESGKWDRTDERFGGRKFGRSTQGHGMTKEMGKIIVDSFRKRARLNMTEPQVYSEALRSDFGCDSRTVTEQCPDSLKKVVKTEFFHPQGRPFPTSRQYWYACKKALGLHFVKTLLCGEENLRHKSGVNRGSFSSNLVNTGEKGFCDVSVADYHLRGVGGQLLPTHRRATCVDGATGLTLGVGFGLGSESSDAYKAMLFCMAIDKVKFGQIINYPIKEGDWPSKGLLAHILSDRGPGSGAPVRNALPHHVVFETTEGYSPVSNSPVESRHIKKRKNSGQPKYKVSSRSAAQEIKMEVERIICNNKAGSALDKCTPEMIFAGVKTPQDAFLFLDVRCRNVFDQIPFDEAVRKFLKRVRFTFSKGKLMAFGMRYVSSDFGKSIFSRRRRAASQVELVGYMYPFAIRKAWVEVEGRLIEVDAQLALANGGDEDEITLSELELFQEMKSEAENTLRSERPAILASGHERYERETGAKWDATRSHSGAAKVDKKATQAEVDFHNLKQ